MQPRSNFFQVMEMKASILILFTAATWWSYPNSDFYAIAMEAANRAPLRIINSNNTRYSEYGYQGIQTFSYKLAKKLVYIQAYHKTQISM